MLPQKAALIQITVGKNDDCAYMIPDCLFIGFVLGTFATGSREFVIEGVR